MEWAKAGGAARLTESSADPVRGDAAEKGCVAPSTRRLGLGGPKSAMLSLLRKILLMPLWLAQVFSQEKFFARNPVIGNRWLNEHGLHTARVALAWRLAAARRRRLARLIPAEDRRQLDSDGFIIKRDFLPPDVFADLVAQVRDLRAPAREITEGDTITRHIALDPAALDRVPAARRLLDLPLYRNLLRYAGSSAAAPMVYIQTVLAGAVAGPPDPPSDPQRDLHTDTFHPTVKAWLFLTDVEPDAMPFVYVPGSHRLTPQRLEWERAMSIAASRQVGEASRQPDQKLIRAISPSVLPELGLPPPRAISAPANTLIVADTFGFHARGPSARPTTRVEIWALGRRNPFLPWTGLDPWSIAALGLRKPMFYWKSVDLLESVGLGHQRWRARGSRSAFDPA